MTLRTLRGSMKPKTAVKSYSQITAVFWHLRTFDLFRFSIHSKRNYQKPLLEPPENNSAHIKSCDRPGGQPSVNVILFRLQASGEDWGSCNWFGVSSTEQSRSSFPKLLSS
jgi:hypothetical protein